MSSITAPEGPLLRALASSNTGRRRAALAQLNTYLSSSRAFTLTDMLKLWKALFYCLYMTPRVRNQQALVGEIGALAQCLTLPERGESLALFVRAFWETMAREWEGIDKVRLDKFLLLVRRMVRVTLSSCRMEVEAEQGEDAEPDEEDAGFNDEIWYPEQLARHIAILAETVLAPRDNKIPVGLRLHVLDVLMDEAEMADPVGATDIQMILGPVKKLQKESLTKSVRERAREVLEDERVAAWGKDEGEPPY